MKNGGLDNVLRLFAVAAVAVFCLQVFSDNKAEVDLWGNVGFVKALPWSPEYHFTNTFSFTEPEHPWVNHEWLAEYIFHITYQNFGNAGLLALKIVLGFCVIFLLNLSMKVDCRVGVIRFLYLLLIISTMGYGFSIRPHHFTYLMYALFLLFLKFHPKNRLVTLLVIPVLGILWVNLHGAFFIGALLMGFFIVFETISKKYVLNESPSARYIPTLLAATALFVAASFINPYGFRLWRFIFQSATDLRPYLSEWAMFHPVRDFFSHVDFMVLALITFTSMLFLRDRRDITWQCILFISFIAAILMRRNIPLFAITAGFAGTRHVDKAAGEIVSQWRKKIPDGLLVFILAVFIPLSGYYGLMFNKTNPMEIEVKKDEFPVETVAFMKANRISGNAIVFFDWAEYCIWKLYPGCRVFLDGRFSDAYSAKTIGDYLNFIYLGPNWRAKAKPSGEDWNTALEEYPTDIVLIHRGNPVYPKMLALVDWQLVHESNIVGLFLKTADHKPFFEAQKKGVLKYPKGTNHPYFP